MKTPIPTFVAIDFETANNSRDSACAVALVRVEKGLVVAKQHWLIRPPTTKFLYSGIHKITWAHVKDSPSFLDVWEEAKSLVADIAFFAAHNAPFDRSVLIACSSTAGLPTPVTAFCCTVQLARKRLGIYPTKLPDVCRHLKIPLRHHDALSDAEACAQIVLAGAAAGRGALTMIAPK